MIKIIKRWLKQIIAEAYEEGYKRGAQDIVLRLAFVFDVCREKAIEEGLAEVGAIKIDDITEEWEEYTDVESA